MLSALTCKDAWVSPRHPAERVPRGPCGPGAAGGQARPEPRAPYAPSPSQPAPERGQRPDGSNLSSQETLSDFLAILPVPPATYPARPPRQEAGAAAAPRVEPQGPGARSVAVQWRTLRGRGFRLPGVCAPVGDGMGVRPRWGSTALDHPRPGKEWGQPRFRSKPWTPGSGRGPQKSSRTSPSSGPALLGRGPKDSLLQVFGKGPREREPH
jgi:hypothetical protein